MIRLEQSSSFEVIENLLHSRGILIFSVFYRETIHCFLYFTIINEHINNLFIENAIMNANRKDFFDLVKSRTWKFLITLLLVFFLFPANCKQSKLFSVALICQNPLVC